MLGGAQGLNLLPLSPGLRLTCAIGACPADPRPMMLCPPSDLWPSCGDRVPCLSPPTPAKLHPSPFRMGMDGLWASEGASVCRTQKNLEGTRAQVHKPCPRSFPQTKQSWRWASCGLRALGLRVAPAATVGERRQLGSCQGQSWSGLRQVTVKGQFVHPAWWPPTMSTGTAHLYWRLPSSTPGLGC